VNRFLTKRSGHFASESSAIHAGGQFSEMPLPGSSACCWVSFIGDPSKCDVIPGDKSVVIPSDRRQTLNVAGMLSNEFLEASYWE